MSTSIIEYCHNPNNNNNNISNLFIDTNQCRFEKHPKTTSTTDKRNENQLESNSEM